jgi:hypothetical protein
MPLICSDDIKRPCLLIQDTLEDTEEQSDVEIDEQIVDIEILDAYDND